MEPVAGVEGARRDHRLVLVHSHPVERRWYPAGIRRWDRRRWRPDGGHGAASLPMEDRHAVGWRWRVHVRDVITLFYLTPQLAEKVERTGVGGILDLVDLAAGELRAEWVGNNLPD